MILAADLNLSVGFEGAHRKNQGTPGQCFTKRMNVWKRKHTHRISLYYFGFLFFGMCSTETGEDFFFFNTGEK